jgi:hypothetical protein
MPKSQTITATLVRGETFVLGQQTFKRSRPELVTAATRRYLEEHAVDMKHYPDVGNDGEGETRVFQKFEFRNGEASEQEETPHE